MENAKPDPLQSPVGQAMVNACQLKWLDVLDNQLPVENKAGESTIFRRESERSDGGC
jgi:hypothetical protein